MQTIKESDWKLFRRLHTVALERFCQQVLTDNENLLRGQNKSIHDRYLAIYDLYQKQNREMAQLFDDLRRSTALQYIALLIRYELLTREEIAMFSDETKVMVSAWLGEKL